MAKIIIFGTGDIAQLASYYFQTDTHHEVVAFTVDKEYIKDESFENKPVVPFEEIAEKYPPADFSMFIAVSYAKMNKVREQKFNEAKQKGYKLESYISSKCSYLSQFKPGDNSFILEDNTIQPFVKIGKNVILWSGNHIGHHSVIKDNNFISSHVVISGHCTIEENCFLGVNSTLAHNITIRKETLLGAGAVISKHTKEKAIYVPPKTIKLDRTSDKIKL